MLFRMLPTQLSSDYRVSLKALIYDPQERILLVKESNDAWWGLPGGGLEHGETIAQGLRRELHEELGIAVASISPQPIFTWVFRAQYAHGLILRHILWVVYKVEIAIQPSGMHNGNIAKFFNKSTIKPSDLADYFNPAFDELIQHRAV